MPSPTRPPTNGAVVWWSSAARPDVGRTEIAMQMSIALGAGDEDGARRRRRRRPGDRAASASADRTERLHGHRRGRARAGRSRLLRDRRPRAAVSRSWRVCPTRARGRRSGRAKSCVWSTASPMQPTSWSPTARACSTMSPVPERARRYATARALVVEADVVVAVCDASPHGVARLLAWAVEVRALAGDAPVVVVVNRAPAARFRRGELYDEITDSLAVHRRRLRAARRARRRRGVGRRRRSARDRSRARSIVSLRSSRRCLGAGAGCRSSRKRRDDAHRRVRRHPPRRAGRRRTAAAAARPRSSATSAPRSNARSTTTSDGRGMGDGAAARRPARDGAARAAFDHRARSAERAARAARRRGDLRRGRARHVSSTSTAGCAVSPNRRPRRRTARSSTGCSRRPNGSSTPSIRSCRRACSTAPRGSTAAIPPIADRLSATVRRYTVRDVTLDALVARDALTEQAAAFLWAAMQLRSRIAVSGEPGAGKTTLAAALLSAVPAVALRAELRGDPRARGARSCTAATTKCGRPDSTAPARSPCAILVKFVLAMRPDRIVVGEVRGAEAFELTRAVNAGCGFLCTVHANSARDALNALVNAALMAGENVTEAHRAQGVRRGARSRRARRPRRSRARRRARPPPGHRDHGGRAEPARRRDVRAAVRARRTRAAARVDRRVAARARAARRPGAATTARACADLHRTAGSRP